MWHHLPRTILAVTAFVTVTVEPAAVTNAEPGAVAAPPAIELVDMPAELAAAAMWSTDLFEQAAFDLPPLRYVFHGNNREPCSERRGLHHRVDGVNVIEICEMSSATPVLILHETAHAWIDHNLTEGRKADFKQLRGWIHWRNFDKAEWHDNGTEQAAEIMVWGLIDRPLAIIRIDQNSCDELDAGYRVLTGQAPLHGYRDAC
jgi:hypothetical protein